MPTSEAQKLKKKLKEKDKEIAELKELLASAETEVKELNDFTGFEKPKKSLLESRMLNTGIKALLFVIISAAIVGIGLYPWLNKENLLNRGADGTADAGESMDVPSEDMLVQEPGNDTSMTAPEESPQAEPPAEETPPPAELEPEEPAEPAQMIEVVSDLGWLNVRDAPSVETGEVIEQINSGERYEWTGKSDDNWYTIILSNGTTGYVSGEYVREL